jgi:hypothetical protein
MKTGLWESKPMYFGLIALIFIISFFLQLFTLANPDLAWLAFATEKMLGGATLYQDLMEPNPPLIFWLYTTPIWLAELFSFSLVFTLKIFILGLVASVLYACAMILKSSSLWQEKERYSFLIALAAALLLSADSYMVFAQREHLLVILLLPYVLLQFPSVSRHNLSAGFQGIVGFSAAIGLCLKPHFFVILFCLGLCRWIQSRSLRQILGTAEMAILGVTISYSAVVCIFTPQYFDWLRIFSSVYGAHGFFKWNALDVAICFVGSGLTGVIIALTLGLFRSEGKIFLQQDKIYLAAVACGAYLEGLLQFKIWEYISYPFVAFGIVFMAAVILLRPVTHFAAFALMAWFFYTPAPWGDPRQEYAHSRYQNLAPAFNAYHEVKKAYFIGLGFMPVEFYRTVSPLAWANKFNTYNYLLAGIMEKNGATGQPTVIARPEKRAIERWLIDTMAADITVKNPELVIIVRRWGKYEKREDTFDFVQWMKKDARLAHILDNYVLDKQQTLFDEFPQQYSEYRFFVPKLKRS